VVRGLGIDYHQAAVLDDELTIASTAHTRGRIRLLFEQTAWRGDPPQVCCRGRVEVVCVRASDGRPCGFPERLRAELTDVG